MSREIKFRVFDVDANKMLDQKFIDKFGLFGLVFIAKNNIKVMQYTGIKDKNGKEIYEGDIVLYPDNGKPIVKLEMGCYWLNGHILGHLHPDGLEVIGNIYENKELLEDDEV